MFFYGLEWSYAAIHNFVLVFKALKENWEILPFFTLIDPEYFQNNYPQGGL